MSEENKAPKLESSLDWVCENPIKSIAAILLVPFSGVQLFQLLMYFISHDEESRTMVGWWARSGQFGDQFGVVTCLLSVVTMILVYQTFKRERLANSSAHNAAVFAERERHFFKLLEVYSRSRDELNVLDSRTYFQSLDAKLMSLMNNSLANARSVNPDVESAANLESIIDNVDKLLQSGAEFYDETEFSECYFKFWVLFDYLERYMKAPKDSYELYRDILFSELLAKEVRLIILFHIRHLLVSGTEKQQVVTSAFRIFDGYCQLRGISSSNHSDMYKFMYDDKTMREIIARRPKRKYGLIGSVGARLG